MKIKNKTVLFLLLFMVWLIYAFLEFRFIKFANNQGLIQLRQTTITLSTLGVFLLTAFIYPLLEEAIFRLPLRAKLPNVAISLLVVPWYFFLSYAFSTDSSAFLSYKLFVVILITILLIFVVLKTKTKARIFLDKLRDRYQMPLVLTSAFLFAIAHFWKISYDSLLYAMLFILVVYFTFGLFLSYVRLKLNFWAGLFLHMLHNLVPYIIVLYYSVKKGENLFIYI